MICSKGDLVSLRYQRGTQFVRDTAKPVISVERLDGVVERGWMQFDKITE